MRLAATTVIALRALRRNKLRSSLTALGIIIGVAAVIAMVSIGNGAKAQVEAQIANLGDNIVTVFPGTAGRGGMSFGRSWGGSLTPEDAQAIRDEVFGIVGVSVEVRDRAQVLAAGLNWNTSITGVDTDFFSIRAWPIVAGESFHEGDVRSATKVCVIGQTVADQLFPGEDPVGQTLRIRNLPFRVVGVLSRKGFNYFGSDQDDVVVVPYTAALTRLTRRTTVSSIIIQSGHATLMSTIQSETEALLNQRRGDREPDFMVRNQQEIAEAATATTKTMTVLLGAIAGVSLMVGGIGIMNIMLVSVTERTREIGIRLAVGAHGRDILAQFLIEAIILSLMGGILGILLGMGVSETLSRINDWPTLVSTTAITVAFVFSGAVGVFFGFYPARQAARLDPIEALRYE